MTSMLPRLSKRRGAGFVIGTLLALSAPAVAQDSSDQGEHRLELHGYLSQAYAASRDHQLLGIPTDGTADYRTAALQIRAALTQKDNFVLQFSHERLGRSPVMASKSEVDLAWVFYERRFGDSFFARAGKVKIPLGIYNELRFVGPVLPFFRPANVFYGEGDYTTETVNGVVLSNSFGSEEAWQLDADVYLGEWSYLQDDNVTRARMTKGLGGQLWLNTPVRGLRVGLGGYRATASNLLRRPADYKDTRVNWHASLDGNFDRFRLSAEYTRNTFESGDFDAYYAHAGVRVTKKLTVNALAGRSHLRFSIPYASFDRDLERDLAVGMSYAFRRDLIVKVENHWTRGHEVEEEGAFFGPPLRTGYTILSLSTFF